MRMTTLAVSLALLAGLFLAVGQADAQYNLRRYIWDGDTDNNWGVADNWRIEWDADGDWGTDNDRAIYNDPNDATYGYGYPTGTNPEAPADSTYVEIDPSVYDPGTVGTINVNVADAGTWKWGGFNVRGDVGDVTLSSATNTLMCHQFVNDTANTLTLDVDTKNTPGKEQFVLHATDANGAIVVNGAIASNPTTGGLRLETGGPGDIIYGSTATATSDNKTLFQPYGGTGDVFFESTVIDGFQPAYMQPGLTRAIFSVPSVNLSQGVRFSYNQAGTNFQLMAKGSQDVDVLMMSTDNAIVFDDDAAADNVLKIGGNYDGGTGVLDATIRSQSGTTHQRVDCNVEVLAGSTLSLDADGNDIKIWNFTGSSSITGAGQVRVVGATDRVLVWDGGTLAADTTVESGGTLYVTGGTITADVTVEAGGTVGVTNDYRGSQEWLVQSAVSGSGTVRVKSTHASRTATLKMGAGGSLDTGMHVTVGPDMDYGCEQSFFDMNGQGDVTIGKLSGRGTVYTRGDTLTVGSLSPSAMYTSTLKGLEIQGGSGALVLDSGGTHNFKIVRTSYDIGSDEVNVTNGASVTLGGRIVIDLASGLADMEPGLSIRDENLINCAAGLGGTTFDSVGWKNSGIWGYEITYDDTAGEVNLITRVSGDVDDDDDCDLDDLGILAGNYDTTSGMVWADGDLDQDGDVDLDDLGVLAGNYDNEYVPPSSTVPEPISLSLLGLGGLALLRRRRR